MDTKKSSTGNYSTGDYSTGDYSTGNCSTGNYSTGDYSTGDYSTGNCSTGNYSTGNYSVGHFCTDDYAPHGWFNIPDTRKWSEVDTPSFVRFKLTEWIDATKMTDKEKEDFPSYVTTEGYLKKYEYKEARSNFWSKTSEQNKQKFFNLPHFNADVFKQITGIDVTTKTTCEGKEVEIDGVKYVLQVKK